MMTLVKLKQRVSVFAIEWLLNGLVCYSIFLLISKLK